MPETETATCAGCAALEVECWHDLTELPLAAALARFYQETDTPTDVQISEYLDDADAISGDAGPGPWVITRLDPIAPWEWAFQINGLVCVIGEGGPDCPATPQAVCRIPAPLPPTQED